MKVFTVTPKTIPPRNRDRTLLHVHSGGYVLNTGEAATREAILLAGFGGFKVISIDYRTPPDFSYPAALDDGMAVYREALSESTVRLCVCCTRKPPFCFRPTSVIAASPSQWG